MEIGIGDTLELKKPHPCGGNRMLVLRIGMDFRLRCLRCGHEFMVSRHNIERRIKAVFPADAGGDTHA